MKSMISSIAVSLTLSLFLIACSNERKQDEASYEAVMALVNVEKTPANPSSELKSEFASYTELISAIDFIESHAKLPPRIAPINGYHRYYAKNPHIAEDSVTNEYDLIAIYIHGRWGQPNNDQYIEIPNKIGTYYAANDNIPMVMDGGCMVITIYFNTHTLKFRKFQDPFTPHINSKSELFDGICNGLA